MADNEATVSTADGGETFGSSTLDLTSLPPTFVLPTHLSIERLHEIEELLSSHGAPLTCDIHEAKIVLGNISRSHRARLELRWKGLRIYDVQMIDVDEQNPGPKFNRVTQAKKKRKVAHKKGTKTGDSIITARENSNTASESVDEIETNTKPISQLSISSLPPSPSASKGSVGNPNLPCLLPDLSPDIIIVIKLEWLNAAVSANQLIPMGPFIILTVRVAPDQEPNKFSDKHVSSAEASTIKQGDVGPANSDSRYHNSRSIMERAKADSKPKPAFSRFRRRDRIAEAAKPDIVGKSFSTSQVPQLLHQTTSEENEFRDSTLPPMPDWVIQNKIYSCERSTPFDSPNADFIQLLKRIRLARELTLDEIGVRAYSTSIASISAYPYRLQSSREVLALPGCDAKISHLFQEYHTTGQLQAVRDIEASEALSCLQTFYEIWGVGAVTAREFYYEKGWRDLDDIIEYGWNSLTRVQQIGLKYYDEFQIKLSRADVEAIADTITRHAILVTDTNIQTVLVGGYRRGQAFCSDVDIILSHPDEAQTYNLISKVVESLQSEGCITHTLTLNLASTHRDQQSTRSSKPGHGFDSLDKALVVWQFPTQTTPTPTTPPKNPTPTPNRNPHHRVDIISSPPRTLGCAILGWTSGTTFNRDLRRYTKSYSKSHGNNWKFDSSGVRERGSGELVDLEGWCGDEEKKGEGIGKGKGTMDWREKERRVFAGLGLEWREPGERCTG